MPVSILEMLQQQRNQADFNDIEVLDSTVEYAANGNLAYLLFTMNAKNGDGVPIQLYKAVKLHRLIRVPKNAKQLKTLMDMQGDVISGLYQAKINFIQIMANIRKPKPIGLVFAYGVQAVSTTSMEEAKRQADQDAAGLVRVFGGTFRTIEMRVPTYEEMEWLRQKMHGMKHLQVVRGLPKPRKSAGDMNNSSGMGTAGNADTEEQTEEFIAGMSDFEYVAILMASPIEEDVLMAWLTALSKDQTKWEGLLNGSKGINFGISLPMMYMANMGASEGWNTGFSEGISESHSDGTSFTESHGITEGTSHTASQGITEGTSLTDGQSLTLGHSDGETLGTSVTEGIAQSHSVGTSETLTETFSEGTSTSDSTGTSESFSTGTNESHSVGTSESYSVGSSSGATSGTSYTETEGASVTESENWSDSHGTSDSTGRSATTQTSQSDNWTQSTSSGTSQSHGGSMSNGESTTNSHAEGRSSTESSNNGWSLGAGPVGVSGGSGDAESSSTTDGIAKGSSSSRGANWNSGTSQSESAGMGGGTSSSSGVSSTSSHSITNSHTEGGGVSESTSESTSLGVTESVSEGTSETYTHGSSETYTTGTSQSHTLGTSQSHGVGTSQSHSIGRSVGTSESWGTTTSQSIGHSQSLSQSDSVSKGVSQSLGQSVSKSASESVGQTYSESASTSRGQSHSDGWGISKGQNQGFSGALNAGAAGTMGVGPALSWSKTYQWKDVEVENILNLLEFQRTRLVSATNGQGAFYVDFFIATEDEKAMKAASALATSAWMNDQAFVSPLQVLDLPAHEEQHLLYHMTAFSPCLTKEGIPGQLESYKYSTVLLADELAAYSHPPRVSEGGLYAEVEDMPVFSVPSNRQDGEIFVGNILSGERYSIERGYETDFQFRIKEGEIMHAFFAGGSRSGKTVTATRVVAEAANNVRRGPHRKRMRFIVMDPKQDWRILARFVEPERFRFYSLADPALLPIKMNLARIPRGVYTERYMNSIVEVFCRSYGLGERGKQILTRAFYEEYTKAGCFQGDGKEFAHERSAAVTMETIYQNLEKKKQEMDDPYAKKKYGNDARDAFTRVMDRMETYGRHGAINHAVFCNPNGMSIDDLLGKDDVVVLESYGLESTTRSFVFGLITSGIYQYCVANGGFVNPKDQYETILVIEEANEVLLGQDSGSGDKNGGGLSGPSEFERIVDQAAGNGLFIWAITQKISQMPQSIIANCGLVFAGRQKIADDIEVCMNTFGRDSRYDDRPIKKWFPRCPTGWFIIQTSRTFDFKDADPVMVKVERLDVEPPTNEELQELMKMREVLPKAFPSI